MLKWLLNDRSCFVKKTTCITSSDVCTRTKTFVSGFALIRMDICKDIHV